MTILCCSYCGAYFDSRVLQDGRILLCCELCWARLRKAEAVVA